ncbi:MAG: rSAM/selenodomain-associated transferase 2 [Pseudomonadales bacterium]|jgi:rSAM/selenodomain-associated transferase 2
MRLSVIIPVLNEQENVARLLTQLAPLQSKDCELIVVDGGSSDASVVNAASANKLLASQPGRAVQMNVGAAQASGEMLWFLHADSLFDGDISSYVDRVTTSQSWGFFCIKLDGRHVFFRVIERMINLRSSLTNVGTGDQGMFVCRNLFDSVGGFQTIPLMEDVALSKSLKHLANANVISISKIITSSRRWQQRGILTTVLLMWSLRLQYFLGVSPARLAEKYR